MTVRFVIGKTLSLRNLRIVPAPLICLPVSGL
jgi:hypothetical protein